MNNRHAAEGRRTIPSPCGHWELVIWPGGRKEIRKTAEGRRAGREGRLTFGAEEAVRAIMDGMKEEQA